MSLRTRIALLVGVTVLLASAIGGIGTTISSRSVGLDRVDRALANDAEAFPAQGPRLASQLQFAFDARRATCNDDADSEEIGSGAAQSETGRSGGRLRFLPEFASNLQLVRANGNVFSACQTLPISADEIAIATTGEGTNYRTVSIEGRAISGVDPRVRRRRCRAVRPQP